MVLDTEMLNDSAHEEIEQAQLLSPPPPTPLGEVAMRYDQDAQAMADGEQYQASRLQEGRDLAAQLTERDGLLPGLGQLVVRMTRRQAVKDLRESPLEERQRFYDKTVEIKENLISKRQLELRRIRLSLAQIPLRARHTLEDFLQQSDAPLPTDLTSNWQNDEQRISAPRTEWLTSQASDEELLGFLRWHIQSLSEQQQGEEFSSAVESMKRDYKSAVLTAVESGWLPKSVEQKVEAVESLRVVIGDVFDTYINKNATGYYYKGTNYAVVAQGIGSTPKARLQSLLSNMKETVPHEFNHAVLGELGPTWMKEAMTEHLAQSFVYGNIETIKPDDRERQGTYIMERLLLWGMLNLGSNGRVAPQLAFQAYAANKEQKKQAFTSFKAELDESWGVEKALFYIDDRHKMIEDELYRQHPHMPLDMLRSNASYRVYLELQQDPQKVFGEEYHAKGRGSKDASTYGSEWLTLGRQAP